MSAGSDVGPGSRRGAAAETVQERQKQYTKNWHNKKEKKNVFKIECCCSYCQLPTENKNFVDF
jgi:hypothetical protein